MLLNTTTKWDIYTKVMDPNMEAPSKTSYNEFVKGDLMDYQDVFRFGKSVDILTIEIENVNYALSDLEKEGIKVYPQPNIIKTIQNKCSQKNFTRKIKFQLLSLNYLIQKKN